MRSQDFLDFDQVFRTTTVSDDRTVVTNIYIGAEHPREGRPEEEAPHPRRERTEEEKREENNKIGCVAIMALLLALSCGFVWASMALMSAGGFW